MIEKIGRYRDNNNLLLFSFKEVTEAYNIIAKVLPSEKVSESYGNGTREVSFMFNSKKKENPKAFSISTFGSDLSKCTKEQLREILSITRSLEEDNTYNDLINRCASELARRKISK
jgi:hypothetical protein